MVWVLIGFFAYMAFILVVGVAAGRRTRGHMESFYLGDRKVGAWVTAISASASSESGWLVLGCVAMGWVYGLAAYWITVGCVLGFVFNWFFFADRIRRASAANGSLTVPEFLGFFQQLRGVADGAQRVADFMRDTRREPAQ